MTDWFTADLHLGHDKVAQLRGFSSTAEHDNTILTNLHHSIGDGSGRLWILGDLSVGNKHEAAALAALNKLAFRHMDATTLHLIAGNHDSVHPMSSQAHKVMDRYVRSGDNYMPTFASVATMASIKIAGERALLSHYPYDGDHRTIDRHEQFRPRDLKATIIHGHTHAPLPISYSDRGSLQICVSLDAWGMKPVTKDTLTRLIQEWKP